MEYEGEPVYVRGGSTGSGSLKLCFTLLMFLLLPPGLAFGQQESSSTFAELIAGAQQAQARNNYAAAEQDYRRAVRLRPDIAELWANLGLMQHEAGDYAGAMKSFEQARRLKPSLYVPTLFLGVDFMRTGRAELAVPLLLKAEAMNARDPLSSLTLGQAYSALGKPVDAIRAFRRAIARNPKQSSGWFGLGMAQLKEIENDARAMTTRYANTAYAKALYAQSLTEQSRYHEAAALYKSILSATDQPPCMLAESGFVELLQGDTATAAQQFAIGRARHPECSLALLGQARLKLGAGDNRAALALLEQAWTRDTGFVDANAARLFAGAPSARVQSFLNAFAARHASGEVRDDLYAAVTRPAFEASSDVETAAIPRIAAREQYMAGHDRRCAGMQEGLLDSGDAGALRMLAACSFFTGDFMLTWDAGRALAALPARADAQALYWSILANEQLAFASLDRFEQLAPNSARTHILMGDIYRQRQRYDDAQREYKQALALEPDSAAALLGSAQAYYGDAKIAATIATARKALATSPDDPEINLLMGEALVSDHEFPQAAPFLLKALRAKPQMLPHVHRLLGVVYDEEGKTQDAIRELKLGAPSDQDGSLHYRLARLYRKIGDKADEAAAIQQMKTLEQEQREHAVIAVRDSHTTNLDNAP